MIKVQLIVITPAPISAQTPPSLSQHPVQKQAKNLFNSQG